jgi:POT family proton-dependent oligopeptide transporter
MGFLYWISSYCTWGWFLKPNISTMVGSLYKTGDERRDKGFYLFYIGINLGAFLGALAVGGVAAKWGWHYGFGLAGIGMALGQVVYFFGLKYLKGTGDFLGASENAEEKELMKKPLSKIDKDRMLVLFLSFLIIIVFWGAFEQAGGLMNLYAEQKTNRMLGFNLPFIGNEVPAAWFQSVNAFFIIVLGTAVAAFWYKWKMKGKEASSLFKMAIGVIIMGLGFLFMTKATTEVIGVDGDFTEKASMIWLVLAYLFHTIGELCASPVALSFITKLAPVKYASFMMGAYFAATGVGNKVAGMVGEYSQSAGEFEIFTGIAVFCTIFGILIIFLLKPLKRLTHGAEDLKGTKHEEAEGFELADN